MDVCAVVADDEVDTGATFDAAGLEMKGDLVSPPPKGDFDAPNDAGVFPKPNEVPDDEGGADAGTALSSSGLEVLYFSASLVNMSASLPLYFANVCVTSGIFCALCVW